MTCFRNGSCRSEAKCASSSIVPPSLPLVASSRCARVISQFHYSLSLSFASFHHDLHPVRAAATPPHTTLRNPAGRETLDSRKVLSIPACLAERADLDFLAPTWTSSLRPGLPTMRSPTPGESLYNDGSSPTQLSKERGCGNHDI